MSDKLIPSIAPPNRSWPRVELEEMVDRWIKATIEAEKRGGNWADALSQMYAEDATYSWNIGPNEEFIATGRKEIRDIALGYQMTGLEDWCYPYHDIIIDEKRGSVIGFWRQISPVKRADGSRIAIEGIGGSWFEYGGNYQWKWQRDFFDLGNAKDAFFQVAGAGALSPIMKKKIQTQARGGLLPGHRRIRPELTPMEKLRNTVAMVKIALTGR